MKVLSLTADEVRAIGRALKGFDVSPNVAFKWGQLALRTAFLAMERPYYR